MFNFYEKGWRWVVAHVGAGGSGLADHTGPPQGKVTRAELAQLFRRELYMSETT